ncbi:MAG: tRNA (adenosine(37)-N6)-threonylcarbamoyltransferase complex dimerization subunit type 1 TsaB [Bacteroidetes bacterium]|nr:tRNA (adenosine(37)-N6)-threonylcarbamoyltransferase complex dimerization subunit type 1 TsaB [Bacteroidota bacterium]HET6243190.1 tRNA (adenosine(37)-N6)-threonylcarbamoyltransferase complex dimerization subunit type 1 TsaB [Bacteroidia bacterium]
MALILNLESATQVCSVSISNNGEVVAIKEHHGEYAHAEKLTVFVSDVLKQAGLTMDRLHAISVSMGPGSYTGLRIGVSAAKGFCYALDIPLIAVSTLQQMALSAALKLKNTSPDVLFCPMIDARRMEVYCAVFNKENVLIQEIEAKIIQDDSFNDLLARNKIYFFGDGSQKCKDLLGANPNAFFLNEVYPSSATMAPLAENSFNKRMFVDTAYFEPYYLKDFVSTVPKKKF